MSDNRLYAVTAFVLRHHVLGEADKIVTLLTLEEGLRRVVAKGLRKANNRIGGRLEAFRECQVLLAKGRNLDVVTQVDSLRRFPEVAKDYDALAAGMAASEVVMAFLEEHDPAPEVYALFAELLGELGPGAPAELLLTAFELQLLDVLGYRPELHACMACDRPIEWSYDVAGLHIEGGSCICVHCEGLVSGRMRRLSGAAWTLLTTLQEKSLAEARALPAPPDGVLGNCRHALREYLAYRAERELKAQGMFDWQPEAQGRPEDPGRPSDAIPPAERPVRG